MAATLTSTGTWTALTMTTTDMTAAKDNFARRVDDWSGFPIQNAEYPELDQFIDLMAAGLGVGHQHAVSVLFHLLSAKMNRENPIRQAIHTA